jgi:hypothetical protein
MKKIQLAAGIAMKVLELISIFIKTEQTVASEPLPGKNIQKNYCYFMVMVTVNFSYLIWGNTS